MEHVRLPGSEVLTAAGSNGLAPVQLPSTDVQQQQQQQQQPGEAPRQQQQQQLDEGQAEQAARAALCARQAAAAGDSSDTDVSDFEEGEGFDSELSTWLAGRLQRMQPGAELSAGSVRVLGRLLDEITVRVLDEAQRVNAAAGAAAAGRSSGDKEVAGTTACSEAAPAAQAAGTADAAAPQQQQQQGAAPQKPQQAAQQATAAEMRRGKQGKLAASTLTSLDIQKALKRVLPGGPEEGKLRPYLPSVTKQAWHLDKQSLKGIKRQKQASGAAAAAGAAAPCSGSGAGSKENEGRQAQ